MRLRSASLRVLFVPAVVFSNTTFLVQAAQADLGSVVAQRPPPVIVPGPPVVVVPSPPPATPPKRIISRREVERVARESARNFADMRLESYGIAAQIRYNVREGLFDERSRTGDFDRADVVRRSSDYSFHLNRFEVEAKSAGEAAGDRAAQNAARYKADLDINGAIDRAIETGRGIVFRPDPAPAPYSGETNPQRLPASVASLLASSSEEDRVQREMRGLLSRSPSRFFLDSYWDLERILDRHDLSIPVEAEGSDVFEEWRRDTSRDTQLEYGQRFFRDITSPDYEDPINNVRTFRAAFDPEYSRQLRSQWRPTVERYNRSANGIGSDAYTRVAAEIAKQSARYDAYATEYSRASVARYQTNYRGYYSAEYERLKDRVLNSSFITRGAIKAQSFNSGSLDVSMGDFINVTIERLANRGSQAGVAAVQILPSAQVQSLRADEVRLNGFTQLAQPAAFAYLGQILDVTAADQTIRLQVKVGDQFFDVNLRATFEELIKRIGQIQGNAPYVQRLAEKAAGFVQNQYQDQSGFSDQYANRRADMLLVRMVALFPRLTEAERAQIRSHGQLFRNAFGSKPVRFDAKRNDWEEADRMMNEMGLAGQAPARE